MSSAPHFESFRKILATGKSRGTVHDFRAVSRAAGAAAVDHWQRRVRNPDHATRGPTTGRAPIHRVLDEDQHEYRRLIGIFS